ncbi:MAG: protelomerase family protein [Waterburya sp.]
MTSSLEKAVNCGKTLWLRKLLGERLPQLDHRDISYQDWFEQILEVMEQRGLVEPRQQKNYLSDIRNAIKILNPSHPALEIVNFDKETWIEINNNDTERIAQRTTKLLKDPNAIVQVAIKLLKSYQWSEIAAGLAVVTGRRCAEVIQTAIFENKTPYSVMFTGSLKRRNEPVKCVFEIPTLCEADLILDAIARLRAKLGKEVMGLSLRQINSKYSGAVANKCDLYFSQLVPPREEDEDNLYTHLFKAIYATIASYWYCPPTVPVIEFRAAICGHYQILDEQNLRLRRSIAAGRNYFDYQISDGQGNLDGRLGIKLHLPGVQVIEPFAHAKRAPGQASPELILGQPDSFAHSSSRQQVNLTMTSSNSSPTNQVIPSFLLSRLELIATKLGLSITETISALFNWTEVGLSLAESLGVEALDPQSLFEAVEQLKQPSSLKVTEQQNQINSEPQSHQSQAEINEIIKDLSASNKLLTQLLSRATIPDAVSFESFSQPPNGGKSNGTGNKHQSLNSFAPKADISVSTSNDQQNPPKDPKSRHSQPKSLKAEEDVNRAIDLIMAFNNQDGLAHNERHYIGIGTLRKVTRRGHTVIKRVLEARKAEIQQHHSLHELNTTHNCRGYSRPSINHVIDFSQLTSCQD